MIERFDVAVVGTGFASTFFLARYLQTAPADARVLVLERGEWRDHASQRANPDALRVAGAETIANVTPHKAWWTSVGVGGGSNCWWACTPRFLPADFALRTRYGVGRDWPIGYDALEPYYCDAEELMSVSGPSDATPFRRSRPYPLPPHRLSVPDQVLQRAHPTSFFVQPTARPSRATPGGRPRCCANGVCHLCPIDSKFTILNSLAHLFRDPRVRLRTGATALALDTEAAGARGIVYRHAQREERARADLFVLGANAFFNPHLLLRSGDASPALGRGLHEQASIWIDVELANMAGFQGSTSITGHGYMLYDGPHRSTQAAVLVETSNVPALRLERGKWRHRLRIKCIAEELPSDEGTVTLSEREPDRPVVRAAPSGDYTQRALAAAPRALEPWLGVLPVERIVVAPESDPTEAHVIGTTPMGTDPRTSVVDADLRHHRLRNVLVLGSSTFPTSSPANPTLTIAALSLRAADRLRDAT